MLKALHRVMSTTTEEFVRGVRTAFPGRVEERPGRLTIADDDNVIEIDFVPGPPHTIALLSLPTLRVTIRFAAGEHAAQAAMLAHMDRSMHRGGG